MEMENPSVTVESSMDLKVKLGDLTSDAINLRTCREYLEDISVTLEAIDDEEKELVDAGVRRRLLQIRISGLDVLASPHSLRSLMEASKADLVKEIAELEDKFKKLGIDPEGFV